MKKLCCLSFVMLIISLAVNAHCRSVFDLDFGWRFHLGQVVGGEDLDFDDSQWPLVNVPHDFQIGQPFSRVACRLPPLSVQRYLYGHTPRRAHAR